MSTQKPSEADYVVAREVAAWLESLAEQEQSSDYLHSLSVYGRVGIVNAQGAGIVASAIQAYNRELAKKAEVLDQSGSVHVGAVKERVTVKVKLLACFMKEGHYGTTYIQRFLTSDGNVLVWFGSTKVARDCFRSSTNDLVDVLSADEPAQDASQRTYYKAYVPGDEFWIKGTVKDHGEYKGVKNTIVARVGVVNAPKAKAPKKVKKVKEVKAATTTP